VLLLTGYFNSSINKLFFVSSSPVIYVSGISVSAQTQYLLGISFLGYHP
jgi:hypothetical protein